LAFEPTTKEEGHMIDVKSPYSALVKELRARSEHWNALATRLQTTYVVLTVLTLALSAAIAAFADHLPTIGVRLMAFGSTLLAALLATFRVAEKARGVRDGWRHLTGALLRFENEENFTARRLIDEYLAAEKLLGHVSTDEKALRDLAEPQPPPPVLP
jgi:hypothetical protein